jgi:hypothetical protein
MFAHERVGVSLSKTGTLTEKTAGYLIEPYSNIDRVAWALEGGYARRVRRLVIRRGVI